MGESNVFITIPNDDVLYLSEGIDTEATKLPREPKEEPKEVTDLGDGESRRKPEVVFQTTLGFALSPMKENIIACDSPLNLVAPGVFLPEWTLTCVSLFMQHSILYEWSRHTFPLATIESLELLFELIYG